jgi:hypothetical protein
VALARSLTDDAPEYGDELVWTPQEPLEGIRVVRMETPRTPSWVAWLAVEVLGR